MSDDVLHDRLTVHVSVGNEATRDQAEGFAEALAVWVGEWMDANPDRGGWDPFVFWHTDSCDDSDHCHGPGSFIERLIFSKRTQ